jgi:hypothetical protein
MARFNYKKPNPFNGISRKAEAKNDNRSYWTIPPVLLPYFFKLDLNCNPELSLFSDDKPYRKPKNGTKPQ